MPCDGLAEPLWDPCSRHTPGDFGTCGLAYRCGPADGAFHYKITPFLNIGSFPFCLPWAFQCGYGTYSSVCDVCYYYSGAGMCDRWSDADCRWEWAGETSCADHLHGSATWQPYPECNCCVVCDVGYAWSEDEQTCVSDTPPPPPAGEGEHHGPACLHLRHTGAFLVVRCSEDTGLLRALRSDDFLPPYSLDVPVLIPPAGSMDMQPTLAQTLRDQVLLLFCRQTGEGEDATYEVLEARSDDDGETWGLEGDAVFENASHPEVKVHPLSGLEVRCAYRDGGIVARRNYPGEDPSAEYTFQDDASADLAVDDDGFRLSPALDNESHWLLVARVGGDVLTYVSTDDCETFALVS